MIDTNREIHLAARPTGLPTSSDFELVEAPMPEPGDGEFLVRNTYLSVDPAMRGWVNDAPNYSPPVPIGAVMRANAVGEVVESRHVDYPVGDTVSGTFGWQRFAVSDGGNVMRKVALRRRTPGRSASWACRGSPPILACSNYVRRRLGKLWSCRQRPARWGPASGR